VHVPLGEYLVIPAHETVLGATLEFIKLPFDTSGEILTKSSVARTFIVVETAPWIHPEYRGCLTLEIANVSNTPVLLYPGRPIGQLVLLKTVRRRKKPTKLKGSYFGPVAPEPPTFRNQKTNSSSLALKLCRSFASFWCEEIRARISVAEFCKDSRAAPAPLHIQIPRL